MKTISFDFTGMFGAKTDIRRDFDGLKSRAADVICSLEEKRPQHAWRALAHNQAAVVADMVKEAVRINESYESFVVLGIGGSALGSRALFTALKHLRHNELARERRGCVKFYVADNVDPDGLSALFDVIDPKKTVFHVITKSGNTVETVAQFMLAMDRLAQALGDGWKDNVIVTTDKEKGNFKKIADAYGFKTYVVPDGVGGRFSVMSPVGLLSAAALKLDIAAMLKGVADMDAMCSIGDIEKNPALMYAALCCAAMKQGVNINVLMPYADALKDTAEWFAQLWAESLGKSVDNCGNTVHVGQTPVRALGVTDQHSQVQLYREGPFDKMITFVEVGQFQNELTIPNPPVDVYDAAYLAGQTFNKLISAECKATEYALKSAGKLTMRFTLSKLNAYTFGALIAFFEIATAAAGEFLNINAFDQPGVEEGKLATFALMGREGYEEKAQQMQSADRRDGTLVYEF